MPKLVTWMNNQRVGELTKLANGAHTFKYAPEWLASRYARPLSLSLPLQRGNITSDAVFNFFDNLLPDSPIVRDRIVKRYHAKSRQPFDLLSEIGRDSVGAVTLIPEDETVTVCHHILCGKTRKLVKTVQCIKMSNECTVIKLFTHFSYSDFFFRLITNSINIIRIHCVTAFIFSHFFVDFSLCNFI